MGNSNIEEKVVIATAVHHNQQHHIPREPCRSMLTSSMYVDRVLSGSNDHCCESFRIDKQIFHKLCDLLQAKNLLSQTNGIRIQEQLAIFLFIIGHSQPSPTVQDLFLRNEETISSCFKDVLKAFMALGPFRPHGSGISTEIRNNPKFYPYFKNCLGVIHMIQVPAMVDVKPPSAWYDRSGKASQKVMVACSFDLRFHYVLAGWEGSAADARVLKSALSNDYGNPFKVPEGKYYLVDGKHGNMPGFIGPYRGGGVRRLCDFRLCDSPDDHPPKNARELFNHRLWLLRNATERNIKVLKESFPILNSAPPYPIDTQTRLVLVVCAIHNYIEKEKRNRLLNKEVILKQNKPLMEFKAQPSAAASKQVTPFQLRDSIATAMWNDYMGN